MRLQIRVEGVQGVAVLGVGRHHPPTPSGSPCVSTISTRFLPLIFLWRPTPSARAGGPVLTLCVSTIAARRPPLPARSEAAAGDQDGQRPVQHRPPPPAQEPAPYALVAAVKVGPTGSFAARAQPSRARCQSAPSMVRVDQSSAGAQPSPADRSCRSPVASGGRACHAAALPGWPARTCAGSAAPSKPSLASFVKSREIGSRARHR